MPFTLPVAGDNPEGRLIRYGVYDELRDFPDECLEFRDVDGYPLSGSGQAAWNFRMLLHIGGHRSPVLRQTVAE